MATLINNDQAKTLIGDNLRHLLSMRGYTQADLARLIFDSVGTAQRMMVSRWVQGKNAPTPADIRNICEALQCSADQILGSEKFSQKVS